MKQIISTLFLLVAVCIFCQAEDEAKFKVIAVIDGNTVLVLANDGSRSNIMLHGVDSPDSGQNYSLEAKLLLEKLVLNKMVTLVPRGKDRYGNILAEITAEGSPDPREELIRKGLAWTTVSEGELEAIKEHARKLGVGLWQEENPTPPWLYRRQQSMLKAKSS